MVLVDSRRAIVIVVLVPVVLPIHNTQAHHAIVDLRQGLVKPFVFTLGDFLANVNPLQVIELDIELGYVWEFLIHECVSCGRKGVMKVNLPRMIVIIILNYYSFWPRLCEMKRAASD